VNQVEKLKFLLLPVELPHIKRSKAKVRPTEANMDASASSSEEEEPQLRRRTRQQDPDEDHLRDLNAEEMDKLVQLQVREISRLVPGRTEEVIFRFALTGHGRLGRRGHLQSPAGE
jgi:hypothetical protein